MAHAVPKAFDDRLKYFEKTIVDTRNWVLMWVFPNTKKSKMLEREAIHGGEKQQFLTAFAHRE
jgi:hypothetical protein